MRKRIAEWSAQGLVQAAMAAVVVAVIGVGQMVWDMIDMETLVEITCLVVLFFCTFFGLKLLHLPNFKFPTQEEYEALKVLGKLKKRTIYMTAIEKETRKNDGDR